MLIDSEICIFIRKKINLRANYILRFTLKYSGISHDHSNVSVQGACSLKRIQCSSGDALGTT